MSLDLDLSSHIIQQTNEFFLMRKFIFRSFAQAGLVLKKWLLTNFWYITFFFVPQHKKHFLLKVEIIEKLGCSNSVRPSTVIYDIYITRTDFEHHFFSIISIQSCFIEMDLLQKVFLLLGHEKNAIYSKLVNSPFKWNYKNSESK